MPSSNTQSPLTPPPTQVEQNDNGITPTLQPRRTARTTGRKSAGASNQNDPVCPLPLQGAPSSTNTADPVNKAINDPDTVMENGEGKKTNGRGRGPSVSVPDDLESAPPPYKRRTPRSGDTALLPLPEITSPGTPPANKPPRSSRAHPRPP